MNTDLIYDVLRRHQPDHVLLRATRADAAGGLTDLGRRRRRCWRGVAGRIRHVRLDRASRRWRCRCCSTSAARACAPGGEDALLAETEALVAEATGERRAAADAADARCPRSAPSRPRATAAQRAAACASARRDDRRAAASRGRAAAARPRRRAGLAGRAACWRSPTCISRRAPPARARGQSGAALGHARDARPAGAAAAPLAAARSWWRSATASTIARGAARLPPGDAARLAAMTGAARVRLGARQPRPAARPTASAAMPSRSGAPGRCVFRHQAAARAPRPARSAATIHPKAAVPTRGGARDPALLRRRRAPADAAGASAPTPAGWTCAHPAIAAAVPARRTRLPARPGPAVQLHPRPGAGAQRGAIGSMPILSIAGWLKRALAGHGQGSRGLYPPRRDKDVNRSSRSRVSGRLSQSRAK